MGNEGFCSKDTRDMRSSTVIKIVDDVPVVRGSFNFTNQETFKKIESAAAIFCQQQHLDKQYVPTVARIIAYRHDNLFEVYRTLPEQQKQQFMDELAYLEIELMDSLFHNFIREKRGSMVMQETPTRVPFIDSETYPMEKYHQCIENGKTLLFEDKVGLVMMCAGASSRFYGQDKFLCPLELQSRKTILQLMLERAASNIKEAGNSSLSIPIIFCCNESNRNLLESYLFKNSYFGFDTKKVRFVQIKNIPMLTKDGKFGLSFERKILERPAGTGKCLEEVLGETLRTFFKSESVRYLHFCGVENVLENPFDPFLIGLLHKEKRDMCAKCVSPAFQSQNFNRYVLSKNKISLIDMDTLTNFAKFKLLAQSPIAMNSIVCDIDSMKQVIRDYNNNMFLSKQYRVSESLADYYDFLNGKPMLKQHCYAFEKEIGDMMTVCQNPLLVRVSRNQFAPVITKNEEYSFKTACRKLIEVEQNKIGMKAKQ